MHFRSGMNKAVAGLLGILLLVGVGHAQAKSPVSFNFTSFDYPGATGTIGYGINQGGIIVGYYVDAAGGEHGFIRLLDGKLQKVDYPGAVGTVLFGINDSKEAVGLYNDTDLVYQGFLFEPPDQFTNIYYSALASSTTPYGINNIGQIVGAWNGDQLQGGFSLLNGTYTELLYPAQNSRTPSA